MSYKVVYRKYTVNIVLPSRHPLGFKRTENKAREKIPLNWSRWIIIIVWVLEYEYFIVFTPTVYKVKRLTIVIQVLCIFTWLFWFFTKNDNRRSIKTYFKKRCCKRFRNVSTQYFSIVRLHTWGSQRCTIIANSVYITFRKLLFGIESTPKVIITVIYFELKQKCHQSYRITIG